MNAKEFDQDFRARLEALATSNLSDACDRVGLVRCAVQGIVPRWGKTKVIGRAVTIRMTAAGAVQLINREKGVLVDVCEPDEYAQGHAAGAKNVPLSQFEAKLGDAVKNKNVPLILVCRTGSRSGRAVALAQKLGYANAQSLGGGLTGWKNANLPVEKA